MGPQDRWLVRALRRGDRDACRELIRAHHAGVYGYLRRLGAHAVLAEDLTQETYSKAWRDIESLRQVASLRSWLLTIARNEFLQSVRAERLRTTSLDHAEERADGNPGAASVLEEAEQGQRVRRAVARLEPELQEAVALHYFQDLSFREVGTVLRIPAGTVKSRISRALGRLRALLESSEQEGSDHDGPRTETASSRHS